jgi:hypothetical protein
MTSIVELLLLAALAAIGYWYLYDGIRGKPHPLRRIGQFAALSDGVDRAVEEGKPVFPTVGGYAYLSGLYSTMTIAGLNVTRYLTQLAVRRGAELRFAIPIQPEVQPLVDGIYREVCIAEGKPEAYKRENVQYFGNTANNYFVGVDGWLARDGCSLYVMVGAAGGGIDTGPIFFARYWGAVTIGGTPRWPHQGTWTILCDYPLHMDDCYALGALCSGDPVVISNQSSADIAKLIVLALTILGAILTLAGLPFFGSKGWLGF